MVPMAAAIAVAAVVPGVAPAHRLVVAIRVVVIRPVVEPRIPTIARAGIVVTTTSETRIDPPGQGVEESTTNPDISSDSTQ